MPASLAAAREARKWPDTRVVVDAGALRDGVLELCALADVVVASQQMAAQLAGEGNPRQAVEKLLDNGAETAGVTLGSKGCVFYAGGAWISLPAFTVNALDTTGAGDAFCAGLIYGMLEGRNWPDCLNYARAVAAVKCTGLGARAALPDAIGLQHFLHKHTKPPQPAAG
jgi:ribokinase